MVDLDCAREEVVRQRLAEVGGQQRLSGRLDCVAKKLREAGIAFELDGFSSDGAIYIPL